MSEADSKNEARLAIIGGTGLYVLQAGTLTSESSISTPYAERPVLLRNYSLEGLDLVFLARHGGKHSVPPHKINYKANIHALAMAGITRIIAVNAVGGVHPELAPGQLGIPEQIIDYTWGRDHTFNDELQTLDGHIDFTWPYTPHLREVLVQACTDAGADFSDKARVYGCTQGPRLETAAEILRMRRDGCDLAGQTGMPEASLAREMGMEYASLCLVVNRAAGLDPEPLTMVRIGRYLQDGMEAVQCVLQQAARIIRDQ